MTTYCHLFENAVRNFKNNIAVVKYKNTSYNAYTYENLQETSQKLFDKVSIYLKPGEIVGVHSTHKVLLPVIVNIIHKCNAAFVCLNPKSDKVAVDQIIKDFNIQNIFTIDNDENFEQFGRVILNSHVGNIDEELCLWTKKIYESAISGYTTNENTVAYVIKTSGSTGISKYVLVLHESIYPNIIDFEILFHVKCDDVIYFSTPLTFDPSIIELYLAAKSGCALLIAPPVLEIILPGENLTEFNVTIWQTTPSLFLMYGLNEIKNKILNDSSTLKILALGGESIQFDVFNLKSLNNKTEIFSLYGITEVSCWASAYKISDSRFITENGHCLGSVLSKTFIRICNDNNEPIVNCIGDLQIGSKTRICLVGEECLKYYNDVKGYINRCENIVWRNTGDLGKEVDSIIYFNGRNDKLIKRYGHKVNLAEIESVAMKFDKVDRCLCLWDKINGIIILFYISREDIDYSLREYLSGSLNIYSLPDDIVRVDNFPVNDHGKISFSKCMELYKTLNVNSNKSVDIGNFFMISLRKDFNDLNDFDKIKNKSFLNIGGTSIMAVQLINRLESIYKMNVSDLYSRLLDPNCSLCDVIDFLKTTDECSAIKNDISNAKNINKRQSEGDTHDKSSKKYCADAKFDLEIVWSFNTGKCVDARVVYFMDSENDEEYVLVGSHSGMAVILHAKTGIPAFTLNCNSRIVSPFYCYFNESEYNSVIGCYDGSFWCISLKNWKIRWKVDLGSMIKSQACHFESNIFVGCYGSKLHKICMNTGSLISSYKISAKGISTDLVRNRNCIFIGCLDGLCCSFNCKNGEEGVIWKRNLDSPIFAKPSLLRNGSFVLFNEVNKKIHCLNSKSGECVWIFDDIRGPLFSSCSIQSSDERDIIIFGCHDKHAYKLSWMKSSSEPNTIWKMKHASEIYATPYLRDDFYTISVSTNGRLRLINSYGNVEGEISLSGEVFSSPAVNENLIYVGCRDDNVYCLKISIKKKYT